MKKAVISIILLIPNYLFAQLNLDNFEAYYDSLAEARVLEVKWKRPPLWQRLLPSVGVSSYVIDGRLIFAPSANINLNNFLTAINERRTQRNKIKAVKMKTSLEKSEDLRRASSLIPLIENNRIEIQNEYKVLELQLKIFSLDSLKFMDNQIDPDQFYNAKIQLIRSQENLNKTLLRKETLYNRLYEILKIDNSINSKFN